MPNPRATARLSIPFLALLLISSIIVLMMNWQFASRLFSFEAIDLTTFGGILADMNRTGVIGILVLGTLTFCFWLIYSKRIFGPMVPFRKHIRELCEGNYSSRIRLRKRDEFKELAEELNRLAETLEKKYKDQSGLGLIEVLVALGVMSIIGMATMTMIENQHRQITVLVQRQEMADLKNTMLTLLSKPNVCSWQLKDRVVNVSGALSEASPSSTVLSLPILRQGTTATSAILAQVNQNLPGSRLRVTSISFRGIYPTGNPNEYRGNFEIVLNSGSTTLATKPVQITQVIQTVASDPLNAKRIDSCGAAAAAATGPEIFPGWPNGIICGGQYWPIFQPGGYNFYGAGAKSTRSSSINFSSQTARGSCNNAGAGNCGLCSSQTMTQLKANGYTR